MTADVTVFEQMLTEWAALTTEPDPVPAWEAALAAMKAEQQAAVAAGTWRTGGRTLMHALGLHEDEVRLCRGLGWLLQPDGWHGLGAGALEGLLTYLGVEVPRTASATIVLEEVRQDTRADIVIRIGATTILLEAKVWALEQPRQADRLAEHWADEQPQLVFLTRDGKRPITAKNSADDWQTLAWSEVADIVEAATHDRTDVSPGVIDYLQILRHYGGKRA